ncbi:MAG: bifunctional enoyl-CoA hydratase/phosphate acetyltransferase [Acetobacter sp.]|nr:bifunctional enoyl-CoA hydratase/phosphate acetyltransferase [Acetobacter sp.]MCH4060127.1 bifunctional enoyl-CoA hydratase/phosphate acetyltransferase [Acetobacter sp.]MCH4087067.1 bifunctional enoyl-CoA hydratase/phosphate acetyltransferase [Acetobacter sp.]MCI1292887.1 bifunctional enoyl-CoA hydratase/phosphate acetyltransferase [Acetobacter sp.]MCI1319473.1 bifunctional enoyl-CoA hydratase/phosphate acetyltransferase [Acetobacter sp.]
MNDLQTPLFTREPTDLNPARSSSPSPHAGFEKLIARAAQGEPVPFAIIWPCEEHALAGPLLAAQHGIITPVLIGDTETIRKVAQVGGHDISACRIVDAPTASAAVTAAVALVHSGDVEGITKGSLHSDVFMRGLVSAEAGLRTSRRMSQAFIIAPPFYPDLVFVTDSAVNIFPDLETKRDIVQNAIDMHIGLGLGTPRVAIVSAVEEINPKIPGTVDAAALCKMAERGQITAGIVDGPLAMDNAIDPEAARIKRIVSPVAGHAQILVAPDLESGNMLAKSLIFMAHADSAGVVMGAKVPILLTSRADSVQARLASAAIGALYARHLKTGLSDH